MRNTLIETSLAVICTVLISSAPLAVRAESLSDTCVARLKAKPITIVVPNEAGGGFDLYTRLFATALEQLLGDPVRVSNMPAAGGRLAYTEVATQGPEETVLLLDNLSDLVAGTDADETLGFGSDAFTALGTIVAEPTVWLGKSGVDLADPELKALVVGAGSVQGSLIEAGLIGRALGFDMRVVAGYDGSSETTAAVLRGETDLAILTITTALRRAEGTDLEVLLVLQDKIHESAPEALVLGGEAGLVEKRSAGLPEAERQERRELANMAIALGGTYRGLATASHVDSGTVDCLREATDVVLSDKGFSEAAQEQGRPVDPIFSAQTIELYNAIRQSQAKVSDDLEALAAELAE